MTELFWQINYILLIVFMKIIIRIFKRVDWQSDERGEI